MNTKITARLVVLAFATCTLAAEPAASPASNGGRVTRIENGLLPAVIIKGAAAPQMTLSERMAHYKVPGVSVAVINNGTIEWARGYGVAEAGVNQPVTTDTLFQAASISKPVAAMGALSLVEKGMLSLDDDVNLKLKSWKVPENEFMKEQKVTLRRLLNHSAGMTVHGFRGYAANETVPSLLEVLDGCKPPANSAPIRVDTIPGTKWRYAGGGFTVAQLLVMDVTGQPFPQFMKETVLDKLGMTHSSFDQPLPKNRDEHSAAAHERNGESVKGRWHTYPEMAAAGLWTTPSDLARFAIEIQQSLTGKSNEVLSKEMTLEMVKPLLGEYGLGLQTDPAAFSHGGANNGFRCKMFAYRETGQGAVVMTNGEGGDPLLDEIFRSIAAEYGWPDFQVSEREVAKVNGKVYESFAGEYQTKNNPLSIIADAGRLFVKAAPFGPERMELLPESETKYFVTVGNVTFTFVKDETGKATELIIQSAKGEPIKAQRVK
jgi:CubicO group peptidase (beta-lactamase class C family)